MIDGGGFQVYSLNWNPNKRFQTTAKTTVVSVVTYRNYVFVSMLADGQNRSIALEFNFKFRILRLQPQLNTTLALKTIIGANLGISTTLECLTALQQKDPCPPESKTVVILVEQNALCTVSPKSREQQSRAPLGPLVC